MRQPLLASQALETVVADTGHIRRAMQEGLTEHIEMSILTAANNTRRLFGYKSILDITDDAETPDELLDLKAEALDALDRDPRLSEYMQAT
ncbi:hypothetical protein COU79_00975 [Candidatus Peregrinibacteria bacterium CG10_big_fil_rev_8_21_14_0_10_54_7]|nr:MAG: hypothetical protein COU79_00975 [Candidatus Peregrinibacteria bacterium CG10_big_fil_rev_8_21_14_0_10_54_7]